LQSDSAPREAALRHLGHDERHAKLGNAGLGTSEAPGWPSRGGAVRRSALRRSHGWPSGGRWAERAERARCLSGPVLSCPVLSCPRWASASRARVGAKQIADFMQAELRRSAARCQIGFGFQRGWSEFRAPGPPSRQPCRAKNDCRGRAWRRARAWSGGRGGHGAHSACARIQGRAEGHCQTATQTCLTWPCPSSRRRCWVSSERPRFRFSLALHARTPAPGSAWAHLFFQLPSVVPSKTSRPLLHALHPSPRAHPSSLPRPIPGPPVATSLPLCCPLATPCYPVSLVLASCLAVWRSPAASSNRLSLARTRRIHLLAPLHRQVSPLPAHCSQRPLARRESLAIHDRHESRLPPSRPHAPRPGRAYPAPERASGFNTR
jgi:hypothetical protein